MSQAAITVEPGKIIERILTLELVRVTERAAVASARLRGRGNEKAADQAAVDAMRRELNKLPIDGTVVIGEGERDEAGGGGRERGLEIEEEKKRKKKAGQKGRGRAPPGGSPPPLRQGYARL